MVAVRVVMLVAEKAVWKAVLKVEKLDPR